MFPGKQTSRTNNTAKELLEKYNFTYTQFPEAPNKNQPNVMYEYQKTRNVFCIFNVPSKWYVPLQLIWQHILDKKLAKEPFCHIDLNEN